VISTTGQRGFKPMAKLASRRLGAGGFEQQADLPAERMTNPLQSATQSQIPLDPVADTARL
jgi:hypothetical protein